MAAASVGVSMQAPSAVDFGAAASAAEDSISSTVVSIAGILAAEIALDVDLDPMDFMVAIPTVMSATFMDTDTKIVPIRTVS